MGGVGNGESLGKRRGDGVSGSGGRWPPCLEESGEIRGGLEDLVDSLAESSEFKSNPASPFADMSRGRLGGLAVRGGRS